RRGGAIHGARIASAVLGTMIVALIGLVALELFGPTVGLTALALAAVYPVLIGLSATLVAENLLSLLLLAAVDAGLRRRRAREAPARVGLVGVRRHAARAGPADARERVPGRAAVARHSVATRASVARRAGGADPRHRARDRALDDSQRDRDAPVHPSVRRDGDH